MSQHARNNPDEKPLFDVVPADIRRRSKHYGSTFTTRTAENEAIETPTLPTFKSPPMNGKSPHDGNPQPAPRNVTELARVVQTIAAEEQFTGGWKAFAAQLYAIGKASGFYDTPASDPQFNHAEKQLLMVSEIIEGFEGLRGAPFPGIPDDKLTHRPMLEVELADTVIRIMNYASHTGLDVAGAIVEKAEFNKTRGRRHGGKRF